MELEAVEDLEKDPGVQFNGPKCDHLILGSTVYTRVTDDETHLGRHILCSTSLSCLFGVTIQLFDNIGSNSIDSNMVIVTC